MLGAGAGRSIQQGLVRSHESVRQLQNSNILHLSIVRHFASGYSLEPVLTPLMAHERMHDTWHLDRQTICTSRMTRWAADDGVVHFWNTNQLKPSVTASQCTSQAGAHRCSTASKLLGNMNSRYQLPTQTLYCSSVNEQAAGWTCFAMQRVSSTNQQLMADMWENPGCERTYIYSAGQASICMHVYKSV